VGSLKELHGALVFFGSLAGAKRSQVPPPA